VGWTERLGEDHWRARWRDPDTGKERSRTFRGRGSKGLADRHLTAIEGSKLDGSYIDPRSGRITVAEWSRTWAEMNADLKPSTRSSYEALVRLYILPTFGTTRLANVTRGKVQAWMSGLRAAGVGPGTVRNAYRALARMLGEAELSRLIPRNPAAGIRAPKSTKTDMKFLTPAQVEQLAETIEPRYSALVFMAGYTGLRWGELAALRPKHLDLLRGTVDVREALSEVGGHLETVSTKTGKERTVGLPRFLCDLLGEHLARYPGEYVFTAPESGPLRAAQLLPKGLEEGTSGCGA